MRPEIAFIGGFVGGIIFVLVIIRRGFLKRLSSEEFELRAPLIGRCAKLTMLSYPGIFTGEYISLRKKTLHLQELLEPDRAFFWADRYGIDYITTEGDREDGKWSPGRFAFLTRGQSHKRPYHLHLNPDIDRKALSIKLSADTGRVISEEDVYPFLFLHEIGHTPGAGNKDFFGLVLTHTISGQRHSLEARRQLFREKRQIEAFADRFALKALEKWHSGS